MSSCFFFLFFNVHELNNFIQMFLKWYLFIYISLEQWFSTLCVWASFGGIKWMTLSHDCPQTIRKQSYAIIIHNRIKNIVMTFSSALVLSVPFYRSQGSDLYQSHASEATNSGLISLVTLSGATHEQPQVLRWVGESMDWKLLGTQQW